MAGALKGGVAGLGSVAPPLPVAGGYRDTGIPDSIGKHPEFEIGNPVTPKTLVSSRTQNPIPTPPLSLHRPPPIAPFR